MSFFLTSFKNSFVYRSSVIFNIIGSVCWILISIALWTFVYQHNPDKISYMISYVILSNIIGMFYTNGMSSAIAGKVTSGAFAIDLIRPVNFISTQYFQLLGRTCSSLIMRGMPIIIIFMPLLSRNAGFNSPIYILCAVISVVLGHFLYIIIYSLIGFMAFTFLEIWPFNRLMDDTIRFLSGSFIPLALFPGWLGTLANLLPFRFMYSFPLQLLIGDVSTDSIISNFIILIIW
jgi:ABC-2 type transport system permease protein